MERHGQLMAEIAGGDNLRLGLWKAAKGKGRQGANTTTPLGVNGPG